MTKEKTNNIEIDLGQFFKSLVKGLEWLLRVILSAFVFYRKKWILFAILFLGGIGVGYVLEKIFSLNDRYKQEIVLAPVNDTKSYLYDFVESLELKFRDKEFLKKIELDSTDIKYLKKIELEPIKETTDILDALQNKYKGQNFFKHFMENYSDESLKGRKYKAFYRHHKLRFIFKQKSSNNSKISKQLLGYLSSNVYFNKELSLMITQKEKNLERNKKTLVFVEDYLDKLSKNPINEEKEIIVIGEESKIPTITSLLGKKENLMDKITEQERFLELNTKLFDIVESSNVVRFPKRIHKRIIIWFPLSLCFLVSLIFLWKEYSIKLEDFINKK